MRTTVTLDSDVELKLRDLMQARRLSFKGALNTALRLGLGMTTRADIVFPTYDLGEAQVDLTHAGRLASALEDEETVRKLAAGR